MRKTSKAGAEAGYTYISVLIVLAVMAISAQTTFIPSESARLRNAEAELIFRGRSYRDAIGSYWRAGGTNARLPPDLEALLSDPRIDGHTHIRRLYADPVSDAPWTLIYGTDGGVTGVASKSQERPRRQGLFAKDIEHFAQASTYAEWTFIFEP